MNSKSGKTVRVGLVQHAGPMGTNPEVNIDQTCRMIRKAASCGAQIIATQELFRSRYFPQVEDEAYFSLAESIPGPTSVKLCHLAGELNVHIVASVFEKRTAGIYHNTAIMIGPTSNGEAAILGKYRKMHIPDEPYYCEKYYFTPGDLGWSTQKTPHATTSILICWDQWFPEAARLTALHGAQIIFYPTAIGWCRDEPMEHRQQQKQAWQIIQRAHAIANGVFVVAINRVGVEDNLEFWGSSFVADPGGTIIAEADEKNEQVLITECDLSKIDQYRQDWPFLRDRRIDAYGDLMNRYSDS